MRANDVERRLETSPGAEALRHSNQGKQLYGPWKGAPYGIE